MSTLDNLDLLLSQLADLPIRFWSCLVPEHNERTDTTTVIWRDGVAYCTAPGCGLTSALTADFADLVLECVPSHPHTALLEEPVRLDTERRAALLRLAQADGQPWGDDQAETGWTDHMAEVMYGRDLDRRLAAATRPCSIETCVLTGDHDRHQNTEGRHWRITPVVTPAADPVARTHATPDARATSALTDHDARAITEAVRAGLRAPVGPGQAQATTINAVLAELGPVLDTIVARAQARA